MAQKRTLPGFKKKDFNYKFFMTPAAFKAQNLNFSKRNMNSTKDMYSLWTGFQGEYINALSW